MSFYPAVPSKPRVFLIIRNGEMAVTVNLSNVRWVCGQKLRQSIIYLNSGENITCNISLFEFARLIRIRPLFIISFLNLGTPSYILRQPEPQLYLS